MVALDKALRRFFSPGFLGVRRPSAARAVRAMLGFPRRLSKGSESVVDPQPTRFNSSYPFGEYYLQQASAIHKAVDTVLLAGLGSAVREVTLAVLQMQPLLHAPTNPATRIEAEAPAARVPTL